MGLETADRYADRLGPFHQGLKETGFVEGQNVAVEYRWAQGPTIDIPRWQPSLYADRSP